jgi:RimJ/RimL family protein N-acetyltransferase
MTFTAAPTLTTDRLTLSAHTAADYDAFAALWADPEVVRFISGKPSTPEESWTRLLRNIGHWSVLGFGGWLVRETATGRFIGEVGLANYRRAIEPKLGDTPEAGWVLTPAAHGLGYATEAVSAILAWSETELGCTRTVCIISPENIASQRVAAKCGYRGIGETMYHGSPILVFERVVGLG